MPSDLFKKIKQIIARYSPAWIRRRWQWRTMDAKIKRFKRRIVEHTYGSYRLSVELADPLAQGWYDRDWNQLPEIQFLMKHKLKTNATVFDVGAHQGVVGMMLSRAVGPGGKIILVEANPHNAAMCRRNLELNQIGWAEVLEAAIAGENGPIQFSNGWNGVVAERSDYGGVFEAKGITLDTMADMHGKPDCVFLDVEGFEMTALKGAQKLLSQPVDWSIEVHVGCGLEELGAKAEQVIHSFPRNRFDLFIHTESDLEPMPLEIMENDKLKNRFFLTAISK